MTIFNDINEIFKYYGTKLPCTQYFLGNFPPWKMTTTCSAWKSFKTFSASSCTKQRLKIKSIPLWYKVSPIMRYLRAWYHIHYHSIVENWGSILWVWRYIINVSHQGSVVVMRNKLLYDQDSSYILYSLLSSNLDTSSANVKDLLALAFTNSRSNSCKINIHFEYFPPMIQRDKMRLMGFILSTIVVFLGSI